MRIWGWRMTELGRWYSVGLTSATIQSTFRAVLVLCSVAVPSLVAAENRPKNMADMFVEHCLRPLESRTVSDKSSLFRWKRSEIEELGEKMGFNLEERDVWSRHDGFPALVIHRASQPCEVMALGMDRQDTAEAWDSVVLAVDARERKRSLGARVKGNREHFYGAFQLEDVGFVQFFGNHLFTNGPGFLTFSAIRTGNASLACELFPKECS